MLTHFGYMESRDGSLWSLAGVQCTENVSSYILTVSYHCLTLGVARLECGSLSAVRPSITETIRLEGNFQGGSVCKEMSMEG